jgi:hypothetical protein
MRRAAATAGLVALVIAGCGATPPQAPLQQAKKLDESLGGISTACGETYQLTAFPGYPRSQLATLEATATSDAQKLASVYNRNPAWIYQSETVSRLVEDSLSLLRSCGLHQAESALRHATQKRAR